MSDDQNSTDVSALLKEYRLPSPLGFGRALAPVMYEAKYREGAWEPGQLVPYGEIGISPGATAVQFAQQIFEGMKAYKVGSDSPLLFRPEMNFRRLSESARRLAMPNVSPEVFANALSQVASALSSVIPGESGQSLYLRPTLFGIDPNFAVQGSENFNFYLLASPSDAYYANPIRVMIEREQSRAAAGGTGAAKVGGNYGATLQAARKSAAAGFDQPLWLDARAQQNIEELSAMNFMAVIDGQLHTPALNDSILAGVTRDSLLRLADNLGIHTVERSMPVNELLDDIQSGRCSEVFACGTGAIVCPISEIGEADGTSQALPCVGELANKLRSELLDVQEGRNADPFGWTVDATNKESLLDRFRQTDPNEQYR